MTPRGYGAAWSALGAGGAALIVFLVVHHPGAAGPALAGPPHPAVPSPSAAAPRVSLPAATPGASGAVPAGQPASVSPSPAASASGATASGRTSSPLPHPSPASGGAAQVAAALVVPLRGSTPVAVRVSVVVPTGPPLGVGGLLTGVVR